jgi:AcrR family transcriptional regulator
VSDRDSDNQHVEAREEHALQRARLLAAARAAVEAEGGSRLTVQRIITRARISRKTFYECFTDAEDCFLAVLEQELARVSRVATTAYEAEPDWRAGMRAAVAALTDQADREPGMARMLIVDSAAIGPRVLARRREVLLDLAGVLEGAPGLDRLAEASPLSAEVLLGAIVGFLHERLLVDPDAHIGELSGPIMAIALMPYLGRRAASEELELARSARTRPARRGRSLNGASALSGLDTRVTYRTMRVMAAIRERPGATNRQVASSAGIVDQGQVSKLLKRLDQLGLIANHGRGAAQGASNSWALTPLGARVETELSPQR